MGRPDMNVVIRTDSPELAPRPADPLDHLAGVLFHKMGTDGVYARTALYEDMVERLAALITRHRETNTEVMRVPPGMDRRPPPPDHAAPRDQHRGDAVPAGHEPRAAGEIRLSEKLPQFARLCL